MMKLLINMPSRGDHWDRLQREYADVIRGYNIQQFDLQYNQVSVQLQYKPFSQSLSPCEALT